MKIDQFLELMDFPLLWQELGMVDAEYVSKCIARYGPGEDDSPEHDRHGLFQYWLQQDPTKEILLRLAKLSFVDPGQHMVVPCAPISCDRRPAMPK